MRMRAHFRVYAVGLVAWLLICRCQTQPVWSQTNSAGAPLVVTPVGTMATSPPSPAVLDQLLAQHEATIQELIRAQQDFEATLARTFSNTVVHLDALSGELAAKREEDLGVIREANHLTLVVVTSLASLLLLGIVVQIILSARALNRLAKALLSPLGSGTPQLAPPAGTFTPRFLPTQPEDSASARFEDTLRRLECRITELENLASQRWAAASKPTSPSHSAEPHGNRGAHPPRVAVSVGEGEAIVFLPGDVGEAGAQPKPKFLKRLLKLLS